MLLGDDALAGLGLELVKLLGQVGAGCEDGSAGRGGVDDVDDGGAGGAVLGQEGGDDGARGLEAREAEFPLGVLVLGVDDDEDAVAGGCGRGLHPDDGAEGGHGLGEKSYSSGWKLEYAREGFLLVEMVQFF